MADLFRVIKPKESRAWLRELAASNYCFHIDDDPKEIYTGDISGGSRTFTDAQAQTISANLRVVDEALGWDKAWEIYYAAVKKAEKVS